MLSRLRCVPCRPYVYICQYSNWPINSACSPHIYMRPISFYFKIDAQILAIKSYDINQLCKGTRSILFAMLYSLSMFWSPTLKAYTSCSLVYSTNVGHKCVHQHRPPQDQPNINMTELFYFGIMSSVYALYSTQLKYRVTICIQQYRAVCIYNFI